MAELNGRPKVVELSLPMPKGLDGHVHLHLTVFGACLMLHLTSTAFGDSGSIARPMGSFVCAVPDRMSPKTALCTTLTEVPSSIEFARRVARILACRIELPVYVGCSMSLSGLVVEEEMNCMTQVIQAVLSKWEDVTTYKAT